jgi:unsaturated rhamnogalacturonyl hydrolase
VAVTHFTARFWVQNGNEMTRLFLRSILGIAVLMLVATATRAAQPSRSTTRPASSMPDYPVPYRAPGIESITRILRAVKSQVEASVMTSITTRPTTNPAAASTGRRFALNTYPMGVIYAGMLSAADATGDKSFVSFDAEHFQMIADAIAKVDLSRLERHRGDVTYLLSPNSLDDCGSIGAALIKARRAGVGPDLQVAIDRIAQYISHKQLRLEDGTLARPRPVRNSIWADDAYMSIPFLAQMGALSGDRKYFDDAAAQMLHFADHLFVPSTGLFTHHWNTVNPDDEPRYYWGRADGWCTVSMVELLDVLPEDHPLRGRILRLFRVHAQALASLQAGDGLWHQMLDRTDSYTETSCSAMFTYALAKGVNRGWLDPTAYGVVAIEGWNGLSTRVDDEGHIIGTCVGTGYADDDVFYYHRPALDDIHGYGPVLLAGSEMIRLLKNPRFRITVPDRSNPMMVLDRDGFNSRPRGP